MKRSLSKEKIHSFCGDVLALRLLSGEEFSKEPIRWHSTSNCVQITGFSGEEDECFSDGILLTLLRPGEAEVVAEINGEEYRCPVTVREMRRFAEGKGLNYYVGDFHDHTSTIHKKDLFLTRESQFPIEYIQQIKEENLLDFSVVSDHAGILNKKEFFRGFADEEKCQPMELILFPGSEAEVTVVKNDRFGIPHKNSGEIVTVNAASHANTHSWEAFFRLLDTSPFAVCALAHPQTFGYSVKGIWNFSLDQNHSPRFRQMVKMIEMGDGVQGREDNLLNEFIYSVALDNGFRVSTTCTSDSHGPRWGFDRFPGKTVIVSSEKSKEAFLDAIWQGRIYATESGNVKVYYEVNDTSAPATVLPMDSYRFHIELSYFQDRPDTHPIQCQVISNGGICIKSVFCESLDAFDFTVFAPEAAYFYLRLIDCEGRKTWSFPVFTGRELPSPERPPLTPLDKAGFTAVDTVSGEDAFPLINNDPLSSYTAQHETCKILLDLQEEKRVCALGHYPRLFFQNPKELRRAQIDPAALCAQFPYEYRLFAGNDKDDLSLAAEGIFRIFGGEEFILFPRQTARFLRLDILSTVGKESGIRRFEKEPVTIGELTPFDLKED